jgi:arsenate reductase-like glutaredoxin family protein
MINRIASFRKTACSIGFQKIPFSKRQLSLALPLIRAQANTNCSMSPRIVSLLPNQAYSKSANTYKSTFQKEISIFQSPLYSEIIRRVPPEEIRIVEERMKKLPQHTLNKFIKSIEQGNWEEILSIESYPFYALKALKDESISVEDFASVMMPWASPDTHKIRIEVFGDNGEVNPQARNLIEQTLQIDGIPQLRDEELTNFFELLSKESPIQKQFFVEFRNSKKLFHLDHFRNKIGDVFWGFNFLSSCNMNGQPKYIIPSLSMMNCFLKVKFKDNAMQLNPVLGFSTAKDIEMSGRINKRDFALRFPDISLPREDGLQKLDGFDFTYHDFFHTAIASYASPSTRNRIIETAHLISNSDFDISYFDNLYINNLYERLIDMELFFHYFDFLKTENKPQWQCVLEEILIPISNSDISEPLLISLLNDIFQKVFKTLDEKEGVKAWINHMEDHLESYISKIEQEIRTLDKQIEVLYLEQKKLKQRFQEDPYEVTRKLSSSNEEISKLNDKQNLYRQIRDLIHKEYALSQGKEHIFQKFLRTLPLTLLETD